MDLRRGITRSDQIGASRMEYFISSIAAILSNNPVVTQEYSVETVAEALFPDSSSYEDDTDFWQILHLLRGSASQELMSYLVEAFTSIGSSKVERHKSFDEASKEKHPQETTVTESSISRLLRLTHELHKTTHEENKVAKVYSKPKAEALSWFAF